MKKFKFMLTDEDYVSRKIVIEAENREDAWKEIFLYQSACKLYRASLLYEWEDDNRYG